MSKLLKAIVAGFVWALTYLYIRRYFNPEVKDYRKYQTDAVYGGIASATAAFAKSIIGQYL